MGAKLLERRDFLFIALALALGGMVAVISALLWPAKGQPAALKLVNDKIHLIGLS